MTRVLTLYVCTLVILVVIDLVFITTAGKALFSMVKDMTLERPRLAPALAFYLIYAGGIVFLANLDGSWQTMLVRGAALGFVAYSTFELTNMALLKNWNWTIVSADIAWGTALTAVASVGGAYAARIILDKMT